MWECDKKKSSCAACDWNNLSALLDRTCEIVCLWAWMYNYSSVPVEQTGGKGEQKRGERVMSETGEWKAKEHWHEAWILLRWRQLHWNALWCIKTKEAARLLCHCCTPCLTHKGRGREQEVRDSRMSKGEERQSSEQQGSLKFFLHSQDTKEQEGCLRLSAIWVT